MKMEALLKIPKIDIKTLHWAHVERK